MGIFLAEYMGSNEDQETLNFKSCLSLILSYIWCIGSLLSLDLN